MNFEWKELKVNGWTCQQICLGGRELGVLDFDTTLTDSPAEFICEYMCVEDPYDVPDGTLQEQQAFCEQVCREKIGSIYLDFKRMFEG